MLARTFGVSGAVWLPELLLTLSQVIWLAIAARFATVLTLNGLEWIGLLPPGFLGPTRLGPLVLPASLFLFTALAWAFAAAFTGRYLVRVIAALMNVYPILPAFLLGLTVVAAFRTVPDYQARFARAGGGRLGSSDDSRTATSTFQLTFAFFSARGLAVGPMGDRRP